jgi:predicted sulfurtransferase
MRNESEIGHFTNAIKPDVDTFRGYPLLKNN